MLSGNLHTNLGGGIENLKIRPRGDNRCESAKITLHVLYPQAHLACNRNGKNHSLEEAIFSTL